METTERIRCSESAPNHPGRFRTIQIHPTRKCNLTCLHCYSSSSPHLKEMLDPAALSRFLVYARREGFNTISVSGGEPFMYAHLEEVLTLAQSEGFNTGIATNGMLLKTDRAHRILEHTDLVAVSIDGPPYLHDFIRGQPGAFDKMFEGVQVLKQHNKPFGFIHTVTPESWASLIWLADFAYEQGAQLLQLHPLEMAGRAGEQLQNHVIDDTLAHQIFILSHYIKSKYANRMLVQLDLLHREYIRTFPEVVNAFAAGPPENPRLSDILDTIVVDERGRIIPVAYGFNENLIIGNVHTFSDTVFADYLHRQMPVLQNVFNQTMQKIHTDVQSDIVNWNEILINESIQAA
ncbi:radical SAM protein [Spirosoma validum]|uniref:Radical SAM protein n=1 Tax=Spirosoma validum TaxID=2771355 RepID=A0A927B5I9_9BACT|nr:radical SAM protein [Spirosoma validum]MBD2755688.1 radical SAM protein [Spirosoma validum]